MADRYRHGDYVVTHDYRRGFVLEQAGEQFGQPTYRVLLTRTHDVEPHQRAQGKWKLPVYSENKISPSGVEPTDGECAAFAECALLGDLTK